MKKIKALLITLLALSLLCACGSNKNNTEGSKQGDTKRESNKSQNGLKELPSEEVKIHIENAKKTIEDLNNNGFTNIKKQMSEEVKKTINENVEKQVQDILESKGKFVDFKEGDAIKQEGEKNLIITQQIANYEKGKILFTITYSEDGKIEGFFLK